MKLRCSWVGSQTLGIKKAELRGLDVLSAESWDIQYDDQYDHRIKDEDQGEEIAEEWGRVS